MEHLEVAEVIAGLIRVTAAVAIGYFVHLLPRHVPWPSRPQRLRFALFHIAAAPLAGLLWFLVSSPVERLLTGRPLEAGMDEFIVIGIYAYAVVAVASYMADARAR